VKEYETEIVEIKGSFCEYVGDFFFIYIFSTADRIKILNRAALFKSHESF